MEEKSIFIRTMGDSPVIRVLDFLLEGRDLDYSLTDIAENSNIGWTTLHRIWDDLEKNQIVKHTRIIGRAKMFRLNKEIPAVKQLIKFYDTLLVQSAEKINKKVMLMEV
jgi:DNA-binding IclR family transcriptional regulator